MEQQTPIVPDKAWFDEFERRFTTVRCAAIRWGGSLISTEQYQADIDYLKQHVRTILVLKDE